MEVLDKVYRAFSNLDKDFARSKKTRTEFILEKFGGDIDMGSMIILDAISGISEPTTEDIEKITFVKEIFKQLSDARDHLDTLPDFQFTNGVIFRELLNLLATAKASGLRQVEVSQEELLRQDGSSIHFISSPEGCAYNRLDSAKVLHVFNENVQSFFADRFRMPLPALESYYARKGSSQLIEVPQRNLKQAVK